LLLILACKCVTERGYNLGLGVTNRTSTNAEGLSVHYLLRWLLGKRPWARSGSKKHLDESWVSDTTTNTTVTTTTTTYCCYL